MAYDFDLFVIGAGSGGVRAARKAAEAGARVAIAEADRVEGESKQISRGLRSLWPLPDDAETGTSKPSRETRVKRFAGVTLRDQRTHGFEFSELLAVAALAKVRPQTHRTISGSRSALEYVNQLFPEKTP